MDLRPRSVRAACALSLVSTVIVPACLAAGEGIVETERVITASRAGDGQPASLLGASVTTLGPDQLRDRQVRSIADALRDVPGVAVSRAGPLGALTQVRLRGTEANHTLVLVDGMEVADPFAGEFDFAALQVDEHARIEVLRGPQSALYGSDAVGGVIQYFTLSGRERPGVSVRAEGGSFASRELAVRWAGVAGGLDYALSAGRQDTDGAPTSRFGVRDIGASNQFASARLAYQATDGVQLRAVLRASQSRADFNDQDFDFASPTYGFVIDTDDRSRLSSVGALLAADFGAPDASLRHALSVQGVISERDAYDSGGRRNGDDATRLKASYVGNLAFTGLGSAQRMVFAVDRERERFRNSSPFATPAQAVTHQLDNTGVVLEYHLEPSARVHLDVAGRHDRNQRFEDATTWRAQAAWQVAGQTRLHAAGGTGIKNPTPIELFGYDPEYFIGNPSLRPERLLGWELGVEQGLFGRRLVLGFVWARSRLDDEIFTRYSPTFVATPDNRDTRSHQRSAELHGRLALGAAWRVDAAWTWLKAREDGEVEVRRPAHTGSLNLTWGAPGGRFDATLTARYNGATEDFNFTNAGPPRVPLASYTLVQLGARWRVRPGLELFGRVENALDEVYEDVHTYRTPGRAGYAGLRVEL